MDRTSRTTHPATSARAVRGRRPTFVLFSLLLAVTPVAEAAAQRVADARAASPAPTAPAAPTARVRRGAVVRVMLRPDSAVIRGPLRLLDSVAVVLEPRSRGSLPRRVELAGVEAIEVYRGRAGPARTLAGAAGGALLMGGAFALIHRGLEKEEEGCYLVCNPLVFLTPLFHPVVGAFLGAVGGGAVAYGTAPERWDRVPLAGR